MEHSGYLYEMPARTVDINNIALYYGILILENIADAMGSELNG
ncbi:MAG: hypothetical protein AB2L24_17865 [Mangrovibacterium sp.]